MSSKIEVPCKLLEVLAVPIPDWHDLDGLGGGMVKDADGAWLHRDDVEALVIAAEKRNAELVDIADELLTAYESTIHSAYCQVNPDNDLIDRAIAALKPTESGASE